MRLGRVVYRKSESKVKGVSEIKTVKIGGMKSVIVYRLG